MRKNEDKGHRESREGTAGGDWISPMRTKSIGTALEVKLAPRW